MPYPEIKYRPSIKPTEQELNEVRVFINQMYDLAIRDLGSLDRVDITYKSWIFRGKGGSKSFERRLFGFPKTS